MPTPIPRHEHHHRHHHAARGAHPPATVSPSILRMTLGERLVVVVVIIAVIWAAVFWAIT